LQKTKNKKQKTKNKKQKTKNKKNIKMKYIYLLFIATGFGLVLSSANTDNLSSVLTADEKVKLFGSACTDCSDGGASCDSTSTPSGPCLGFGTVVTACGGQSGKQCTASKNSSTCNDSGPLQNCPTGDNYECVNEPGLGLFWQATGTKGPCGKYKSCSATNRKVNDPACDKKPPVKGE
jgi:hypothetical protein